MNRSKAEASIRNAAELCAFVEKLGYRDQLNGQLQFANGAFASSLLDFFNDNPGAIEAVQQWVLNNPSLLAQADDDEENEPDDFDDEKDDDDDDDYDDDDDDDDGSDW